MTKENEHGTTESKAVDQQQACSALVAARLYAQLEYHFEYAPTTYMMSRERYVATAEGRMTLEALDAYRKETGAEDTYAHSMFRQNNSDQKHFCAFRQEHYEPQICGFRTGRRVHECCF